MYPQGHAADIAESYKAMLSGFGVDFAAAAAAQRGKGSEKVARGAYRNVIQIPGDLTWKIVEEARGSEDGNETGATFSFTLGSGSYATICIREILRSEVALVTVEAATGS